MTVSATPAWGQCGICTLCIHMSLATSNLSSRSQPTAYGCAFSYAQQPPSPHAQPGRHKSVDRPHCMACQICPALHKSCQPRTGGPLLMFYISHPGKNSSYMADAKTAAASLQQPAVTSPTSNTSPTDCKTRCRSLANISTPCSCRPCCHHCWQQATTSLHDRQSKEPTRASVPLRQQL